MLSPALCFCFFFQHQYWIYWNVTARYSQKWVYTVCIYQHISHYTGLWILAHVFLLSWEAAAAAAAAAAVPTADGRHKWLRVSVSVCGIKRVNGMPSLNVLWVISSNYQLTKNMRYFFSPLPWYRLLRWWRHKLYIAAYFQQAVTYVTRGPQWDSFPALQFRAPKLALFSSRPIILKQRNCNLCIWASDGALFPAAL